MGKWGKYTHNYQKSWENEKLFKGWLTKNPNANSDITGSEARCTYCETNLRAHHKDLEKHADTKKHRDRASAYNRAKQPSLSDKGVAVIGQEAKNIDLRLAVYVATHSAVRSIDHLGDLLKILGKGSKLEDVRLHRTKCSKLVLNVIAPAMLSELVEDIGSKCFSLIVDESTDISVIKYLAFCVRYFSSSKKKIVTDFLGFVVVEKATGELLSESTVAYLKEIGSDIKNCVGIGSDNAANMTGKDHGFFKYFKEKAPRARLIKCTCHSLHLCGSKAAAELPADLEFLVRESRNWFSSRPLRRMQYQKLYSLINDGDMPKNLVQLSETRWLAWGKAISTLVTQWLELKTHFDLHVRGLDPGDKCTIGRKLRELCHDEANLFYLLFLKPVTMELNKANLKFQLDSTEVAKLFCDLRVLLVSFVKRIIKPAYIKTNEEGQFLSERDFENLAQALADPQAYLPIDSVDFGASFTIHLGRVHLPLEKITEVKRRCLNYLSVLCKQLAERLPANIGLYESIRYLCPEECLKPSNRIDFMKLPLELAGPAVDVDTLKSQWDQLLLVGLQNHFGEMTTNSSTEFWIRLLDFKDSSNTPMFEELSKFALQVLSLPFSNASIERAFSVMNTIKNKSRNKLSVSLLMAIMRVRLRFGVTQGCCNTFQPTPKMLQLFTSQMYETLNDPQNIISVPSRRANDGGDDEEEMSYFGALELLAAADDLIA